MTKAEKSALIDRVHIVMCLLITILLVVIGALIWTSSYRNLQASIAEEREQYVTELTSQIAEKVAATVTKQKAEMAGYANLINVTRPTTFGDLNADFRAINAEDDDDRVLFLSDDGTVYALSGASVRVSDSSFLVDVGRKGEYASSFTALGTAGDFWLFGAPIEPITVDGIRMVGVIRAYKSEYFRKDLTFQMFGSRVLSFLIDEAGCILMKPEATEGYGNSLFNALSKMGMDRETGNELALAVQKRQDYSAFYESDGCGWLIQTAYVMDLYSVAVLVPIEAAANTMNTVQSTMLHMGGVLLALILIAASLVYLLRKRSAAQRIQRERLQAEMMLQLANRKTDFLSRMSHEIRTPLGGILGELFMAKGNLDKRAELAGNLERIQYSADYLLSLVNDILDMSKIEHGKMKIALSPNNAEDVLEDVINQYREAANANRVAIEILGERRLPDSYLLDNLRVTQIMMNLVSNAVKFTPAGGRITLRMTVVPLDEYTDTVTYTVSDTGEGMSADFLSRVFLPFEQASASTAQEHGGSGLGLAIVKNLTDLMGGRIDVESEPGKGSVFTVSLPLRKTAKIERRTQSGNESILPDNGNAYFHGQHILVCEDSIVNIKLIKSMLTDWGLDVTIAKNGKLGVDAFVASKPGYYSLILMDIRMPVMDGYEAARHIRSSAHPDAAKIPIYALSANSFDDDVQKALASGMNGHMAKPMKIPIIQRLLLDTIQKEGTSHER